MWQSSGFLHSKDHGPLPFRRHSHPRGAYSPPGDSGASAMHVRPKAAHACRALGGPIGWHFPVGGNHKGFACAEHGGWEPLATAAGCNSRAPAYTDKNPGG